VKKKRAFSPKKKIRAIRKERKFFSHVSGAEGKSKLEIKSKLLEVNQSSPVILQQD
jgi:hypothetical protein